MYKVYVLQNPQEILYKGHTNDIEKRIKDHNTPNSKFSKFTKNKGPWQLVYTEEFRTRSEAMKREKYFKTGKGRDELKRLLGRGSRPRPTND